MRPHRRAPDPFAISASGLRRYDREPIHLCEAPDGGEKAAELSALGYTHVLIDRESRLPESVDRYHASGLKAIVARTLPQSAAKAEWKACRKELSNLLGRGLSDGYLLKLPVPLSPALYAPVRALVSRLKRDFPGALLIAKGFDFPMTTAPQALGGLGFDLKRNDGWAEDIGAYLGYEPRYRRYHHDLLTYSLKAAFHERYLISLPHGNLAPFDFMAFGDEWQRLASIRTLYGYLMAHPGKKASFPLDGPPELMACAKRLNELYLSSPALREEGESDYLMLSPNDVDNSVIAFLRTGSNGDGMLCVFNFSTALHPVYRLGLPREGRIDEVFNTDRKIYGGGNQFNAYDIHARAGFYNGFPCWAEVCVPPLSCVYFTYRPFEQSGTTTWEGGRQ